ncbi:MAG: glycosyltransferase [Candidatus Polarisedimenticolia bacterium]
MTLATLVGALLGLWLAAAVAYQIAAQLALRGLLSGRPRPRAGRLPSATILRPLGGGAPRLEESLEGLCAAGAPVVAGMEKGRSEALAAARRVLRRTGPRSLTIVTGSGPAGFNRKIANLIQMMPEARGDVVVFTDGDIGVPEGYLEAVLAPFADPDVGMVTCPYRSVGGSTAASRVDAVLTNTAFLPSVALAARLEGVRFALGATMAIRRTVLDRIGGLAPLLNHIADDWALADRARRAGCRIALAPLLLDHHVGDSGWSEMWLRHLRWARTNRALRPAGYAGFAITHGWLPALGLATLGGWSGAAAVPLAAWGLARLSGVLLNARRTGCGLHDLLLIPLADVLSLALHAGGFCGRTVRWGEARLRIRPGGAIMSARPGHGASPQADTAVSD